MNDGFVRYTPDLILGLGGTVAIILGAIRQDEKMNDFLRWISLIFLGACAVALSASRVPEMVPAAAESGAWLVGAPLKVAFGLVFLAIVAWTVIAANPPRSSAGEWYGLLLFAALGMLVLARAANLAGVFLGVETLSLALYVLIAFYYRRGYALRAGAMYLVLAGFASGFLVFGMALVYAAYGQIEIAGIQEAIRAAKGVGALGLIGFGLFLVGVSFKLAVVPFHMWAAEVYEASPGPVAGIIASASKGATMAALIPFLFLLPSHGGIIALLAGLSMIGGNLLGLRELRVKRILAYSSIAHVGYILLGFLGGGLPAIGTVSGVRAILFYVVAYALAILGAFVVLSLLAQEREPDLNDLRGMGRRHPVLASCMLVFVASLAGLPPAAGFLGKIYLFAAAFRAEYVTLAVIGLIGSAIGIYYYMRILVYMYMTPEEGTSFRMVSTPLQERALIASAIATVFFGVFPDAVFSLLRL